MGSVPDRGSFAARIGPSGEPDGSSLRAVLYRQAVGVAQTLLIHVDVVAHGRQLVADGDRYALLHVEQVRYHEAEAGRGDRLLDVHVEVDDVREHLRRYLQDGTTAGGPYGHPRPPVAHDEGRAERVGDLASGGGVEGVARGLEAGPRDLVVEPDARTFRHNLAPEDVAQGLRRADHVPLPVRHDEVSGVLLRVGGRVVRGRTGSGRVELHGRLVRRGLREVYPRRFAGPVLLEEQRVQPGLPRLRVDVLPGRGGEVLGDLRERVHVRDAVVVGLLQVELAHDPEPDERAPRGGRGRRRDHPVAPVVYADGLPPPGAVVAQILHAQETAVLLHLGDHGLAQVAAVHRPGSLPGYGAQRVRQILLHEAVSRSQRRSVVPVDGLRVLGERGVLGPDPTCQLVADDETVICIPYGGIEEVLPLQVAVLLREGLPSLQVARRGDDRSAAPVLLVVRRRRAEDRGVHRRRDPAADLEKARLSLLGAVDDDRTVPADAAHLRLDDVEGGGDRHRRVESVPAILQDLQAGPRGERVGGADHAVRADRRAGRRVPARRPLDGFGRGLRGRLFGRTLRCGGLFRGRNSLGAAVSRSVIPGHGLSTRTQDSHEQRHQKNSSQNTPPKSTFSTPDSARSVGATP